MRIFNKEIINKEGQEVELMGWVATRRDHGKIIFIDLRDKSGISQLVFMLENKEIYKTADKLRSEWVIRVKGEVKKRPKGMENPELETGQYEIAVNFLEILAESKTPPFDVSTDGYKVNEEIRMKYRYLDLRRPRLQKNLKLRAKFIKFIRDFLTEKGFVEIETPIITKSTPEGARDFIVPSRLQPGKFYALPQSPQQYKQLLMVSGFEKYFQIAKCFRDEDSRANRAYGEFTQLDLEMSFVEQNDILELTERLFTELIMQIFPEKKITQIPWPKINYHETIEKYGNDTPDIRKNKDDKNELGFAWVINFPLFTKQTEKDFFYGSGKSKWAPSHHMFTAPYPDDIKLLDTDPGKVRGLQHDMVLNGVEVGGGSIRIHDPKIQEKVFELIGFTKEQKGRFEHMLEAFNYGVPPHAGIALGLDRLIAILQNEPNIREIIAFPKTGDGRDLMMQAPSEVDKQQLDELGIKIKAKNSHINKAQPRS